MRAVGRPRGPPDCDAARSGPSPREYLPIVPPEWGEPCQARLADLTRSASRIDVNIPGRRLLVARALLGEELKRIEKPAIGQNLVMQVVSSGAAGGADAADDVAAFDLIAGFD